MSVQLPPPEPEARAISDALVKHVENAILHAGGCLSFERFMASALYEPGLGYYSNGLMPFGEQGDFITAPESGELFGRCLAQCMASVLRRMDRGEVLELGAGSGALAVDMLRAWEAVGELPDRYTILEPSAAMRSLQEATLGKQVPHLMDRVAWLQELPSQGIRGVVFGNEVADALPVRRFRWSREQVSELGVSWESGRLLDCEQNADEALREFVTPLAGEYRWRDGYQSEYCPSLGAWVASLADVLTQGLLLLIDYGYSRAEYYLAQRSMGTLMCHYRHRAHTDPFHFPGLQDITAFVDFTAIAEAATEAGLDLQGFSSQASFLLACGIDQLLAAEDPADTRRFLELSNQVKRLVLPGEMGERFKVIGFSRGLQQTVRGFSEADLRSRL